MRVHPAESRSAERPANVTRRGPGETLARPRQTRAPARRKAVADAQAGTGAHARADAAADTQAA